MRELYLKSLEINKNEIPKDNYIYNLSVIKNFKKIEFKQPITIFVGENGLGKSTLIEAIATKCGFVNTFCRKIFVKCLQSSICGGIM